MILFLFGRGLLSSRRDRGRCHESSEVAGVGGAHPRWHPLRAGKLGGGTAVYCSNRCFSFFFSSMETLNHVSAFPAICISHDS